MKDSTTTTSDSSLKTDNTTQEKSFRREYLTRMELRIYKVMH